MTRIPLATKADLDATNARIDGLPTTSGAPGESAYQLWLDQGNVGTVNDFLNSLAGPPGTTGDSAYEEWLSLGNVGTIQDFLASLVGPIGLQGPPGITGGPVDNRDATVLVLPPAGTDVNAVVVKAPDAAWEADAGTYGANQAFLVLRADDPAAVILPDDLVVARVDGKGGAGMVGGAHFGTGMHWRAGTPLPNYSIHVNPVIDVTGIYVDSGIAIPTTPYQQWRQRDQSQTPNVITVVAEVQSSGLIKANRGLDISSVDNATVPALRIGRAAALEGQFAIQSSGSALLAGAVAGDVIVAPIASARQVIIGSGFQGQTAAIRAGNNILGFHGTAPVAKAAVAGSRGGNAALASLLTTLANKGLITDSTTA